jgi:hypothetical protein
MRAINVAVVAAALGAAAAFTGNASNAMPVGGLAAASNELASDVVQDVRWRGRSRWYPRYYVVQPYYVYSPYYAYYGWPYYRPYWGWGWGWGRWWW